MPPLLAIDDLWLRYRAEGAPAEALRGVSLEIGDQEAVGIVGESGCGKSTLAAAILGLLPANAEIVRGAIRYKGRDLLRVPPRALRKVRGREIAMVFQDPMATFNPVLTMGEQLADFQRGGLRRRERLERAEAMLARVGIADPALRMRSYPHEMSGGMRQRAAIAAALLSNPGLLIADEPTTALDVTMEAQILHLMRELRRDYRGSILIISHQLGVIAELCDRVVVMYAGEVVESGTVEDIFHRPAHPYTRKLLACDPARIKGQQTLLPTIAGELPDPRRLPEGCVFAPRCGLAAPLCRSERPPFAFVSKAHWARCHEAWL
jgi:oligopeptide/dipeptide ABC transporter ATP-binding protein